MPTPACLYNNPVQKLCRSLWLILVLAAAGCAHDVDYLLNATYNIADIDISEQYIEIPGDVSADFFEGETVEITQSSVYNRKFIVTTIETTTTAYMTYARPSSLATRRFIPPERSSSAPSWDKAWT